MQFKRSSIAEEIALKRCNYVVRESSGFNLAGSVFCKRLNPRGSVFGVKSLFQCNWLLTTSASLLRQKSFLAFFAPSRDAPCEWFNLSSCILAFPWLCAVMRYRLYRDYKSRLSVLRDALR